ncbi:MAG: asparagine synthase (glutamine-hydrolyzing) [Acidobacteria bacterium]|nr:MAG: asparagine synthase (glutamine-hydrolyzing) [Acidobacteriota bacterium]
MCGICGVWEYGASDGRVEGSLIARMRDEMTHRGPDDSGELLFDKNRGGFGFRRLSIIDLSAAGHQPMHGCDDSTWLVFNGEIYNHAQLRVGLEERGHKYSSRTDSETILHLYEERGIEFVHDIEGDYAIALWDSNQERLVLVRDRIGVKPLYYYYKDGRFIFASEIKAIVQHPAVTPDIDEQALYHYLTFLTTPAPNTLFKEIHKLPAGHTLTLSRDGQLNIRQYWDALPGKFDASRTEAEHEAEILRLLRASIRKRMMSDVPFGVFLSGGVDSSANVALMSEQMSRPVQTFTVGFSDAEYLNELESARRIATQFGTNHHEVIISEKEMKDFLPDLVFHQDEPIADPVCVPLYYVSKLARDSGTIVVQVGEGSDEIFSGYENYVRHLRIYEKFWRYAENLPLALRRAVSTVSRPALEATGRKRMAIELLRRLGADEPLFWGGVVVYDEAFKPKVLSAQMRQRMNGLSSLHVVESYLKHIERERPESDFLSRMTYLELKLRLPELLLMRVDKITMATSVEARVPFLDHHLVEYALSIPRALKVQGGSGKHILKRALEDVLPHDLLYEPKRGFGAPVREWFREGLGGWFDDHLMNSTLRRRNLLDYDFIARMLAEHRSRKKDWGFHLWALLNLSLWYERWIDRG